MNRPAAPELTVGAAPARAVARPGQLLAFKWVLFRLFERASELKSPAAQRENPPPPFGVGRPSAWIFVSTIGELNAIEPFLRAFVAELAPTPITLITDRKIYRASYLEKYPAAYVYETDGTSGDVERLAVLTPPKLLLIAEIPCVLTDAPCRFSFAFVYSAKRCGVPVALLNGWLYGYEPPSRLDALEKRWFGRDYLRLMDVITVQNDDVRTRLVAAGARPESVHVTGNTKFDAVVKQTWSPSGKRSETILRNIVESGRPTVVAGCVTEFEDQVMILDAYAVLCREVSKAFLVLAPRHPEEKDRMAKLEALLKERQLVHAFRSRLGDERLGQGLQVLVLDTMGELKDFYAAGSIAFVGRDHNILEPLSFHKPTTIPPGWETTFPSYPVYKLLTDAAVVREFSDAGSLGGEWARLIGNDTSSSPAHELVETVLARLKGASAANMARLRALCVRPGAEK